MCKVINIDLTRNDLVWSKIIHSLQSGNKMNSQLSYIKYDCKQLKKLRLCFSNNFKDKAIRPKLYSLA